MLETALIAQKNYNNSSPASLLLHWDGTPGQQAGSGTASIGVAEVTGNSTSAGIYSSAKFINAVVAYGATAVDVSAAATSVAFCNPTKPNINNHSGDFTLEFYVAKKNAAMTALNPLATDRYSSDLTTSFPNAGYPPSGFTSGRPMSFYFYLDPNKTLCYTMQGLSGVEPTAWWNTYLSTGVNYWDQLSTTRMVHLLFQMRKKNFEGYLNGVRQFSIPNPNWTGAQYSSQLDLGNNYTLNLQSKDLYFDEVRYTKGVARARGNFAPPTSAFPG